MIGIFSQLGDGALKSILLLLAPTITVVVTFFWNSFWEEAKQIVEDRRIKKQIVKQEALVRRLEDDGHVPDKVKAEARDALNTLRTLEAQLSEQARARHCLKH